MKNRFVSFFCFLASVSLFAQKDSIVNYLEEVSVVADKNIKHNSLGLKIITLGDSVILKNRESFTSLLRFNALIYMRENGAGGVSTARFRGTSSSNTVVVWNGININSINDGLTGFNSMSVSLVDHIDVRSGGGSLKYGSGAIGGTIHLNTDLKFQNHLSNQVVSSIGSYNTFQNLYKFSYGSDSFAFKCGISTNQSENDYPWLGTNFKNENGAYRNINYNLNAANRINKYTTWSLYLTSYHGTRNFSGEMPNPASANDTYKDNNRRALFLFEYKKHQFSHTAKLAYLFQEYRYYADKSHASFDYGKSKTFLFNYDFKFKFSSYSKLEAFTEYTSILGGTNEIAEKQRRQVSQAVIFSHKNNSFSYNLKLRKDFNSDYQIPFVAAFGFEIPLSNQFSARINSSSNYRVPSYNDLYWPGQGNLDLQPEKSKQIDLGLVFEKENMSIALDYFSIQTSEKIVWIPGGDPQKPALWVPVNFASVKNKGIEISTVYKKDFTTGILQLNANYSQISARDLRTNSFLIFTPKHISNLNIGWTAKKWTVFYQYLYNGKVFTSEDNLDILSLPSYHVSNVGVDFTIAKSSKTQLKIGVKINNIYDESYATSPRRPMPNRNFKTIINYKF
jgi:vitamin B12 transporter